jgi:SulP family sulfate permease
MQNIFSHFRKDFTASIVVFFVALPLCLGIALASGAPLFSGIIAGVVGGVVVGFFSNSSLGVSGPAAGLVTVVAGFLATLSGSWTAFLMVVVLAGVIQLICGYLRLGTIAYYFPSSVINGMLAGIGLLIAMKQFPYIVGHNISLTFDANFLQGIKDIFIGINTSTMFITLISGALLIIWEMRFAKKIKFFKTVPAPVVVVILGIILFKAFNGSALISLTETQMVQIPISNSASEFFSQFHTPDFSALYNPAIYGMALIMALIASIETLLCVEAADKLDPKRRITSANRELKAQGVGNIVSGLIGGLPITQVIVRSSANVSFGARTKLSTILHGVLLFMSAVLIPSILNFIPLVSLSCVLVAVGYKLARPELFKKMYSLGSEQFVPFVVTVFGVLFLGLLNGVGIGMICAIFFIFYNHLKNSYHKIEDDEVAGGHHIIKLAEEVSFLNKGSIMQMLNHIPEGASVLIDGSNSKYIHYDVLEIIRDFKINSRSKKISLEIKNIILRGE